MPSMDSTFHSQAPLVMPAAPVFSAPLYDSGPMYRAAALPPPPPPPNPPPKWNQANRQSWKRGGFKSKINTNNSKRNIRVPSTKVNMKRLRQQNAKGARKHFQGELSTSVCPRPLRKPALLLAYNVRVLLQGRLSLLAACRLRLTTTTCFFVIKQVSAKVHVCFNTA